MDSPKKSMYGKRPLWQWLLFYIIIGGVIYFLVYYLFFAKNGGYNYSASGTSQQNSNYKY